MFLKKLLLVSVAIAALIPSAWADDSGITCSIPDVTTAYELSDVTDGTKEFALVNADNQALFYSNTSGQNYIYLADINEIAGWGTVGYKYQTFKISQEVESGKFLIKLGTSDSYFQSTETIATKSSSTDVCFGYSDLKSQNGADGKNYAVWSFEEVDGGGYKIKNVGIGAYVAKNAPSAACASSDDAGVWYIRPIVTKTVTNKMASGEDITIYALRNSTSSSSSYPKNKIPFVNERYSGSGSIAAGNDIITRTFSNLKVGTYEVTVCAAVSSANSVTTVSGDNLSEVFAGDQKSPLSVSIRSSVAPSEFPSYTFTTVVENGTLKCGINNLAASGNWYLLRVPKIVCQKDAASTIKDIISSYITDAEAVTGNMYTETKKTLSEAITAAKSLDSKTDDEIEKIFEDLKAATSAAKASVAEYEEMAKYTYLTSVQEKADELDGAGKTAFSSSSNEIKSNVTDGKYENTAAYEAAIDEAYVKAVKKQTTLNSDWTGVISNADFKTSDLSAWTFANDEKPHTLDVTNHNCEYYLQDFDLSQTITGMKKGTYELSLQAFQRLGYANTEEEKTTLMDEYRKGTWTSCAELYTTAQTSDVKNIFEYAQTTKLYDVSGYWGNDTEVAYNDSTFYVPFSMTGTKTWFEQVDADGVPYYTTTAKAVVTEEGGSLKFGFRGNLKDVKGWLIFDNFKLKYINEAVLVDAAESEKLLASVPSTSYLATLKAKVDACVKDLESDKTNGTYYAALQDVIGDAQTSAKAYASAKDGIAKVKEVLASTNVYTAEAYKTLSESNAAVEKAYGEATLSTEDAAAYYAKVFGTGSSRAANTIDDFLLSAWGTTDYNGLPYINTWSSEVTDLTVPFFEYWSTAALGGKTLTATLDGLNPNALYDVTALTRIQSTSTTDEPYGITLQVGSGIPVDVCDVTKSAEGKNSSNDIVKDDSGNITTARYCGTYTATGRADAKGTLTIKYNVAADNNVSWLIFQNVNYKASAATLADDSSVKELRSKVNDNVAKLGFEEGEYAPYNNVTAIADAATINNYLGTEGVNVTADEYNAAKALFDADPWTANEAEVNAIYDGTFANAVNDGAPAGWVTDYATGLGGSGHARAFVNNSNLSEFNDTKSAFFARFDGYESDITTVYTYGTTEGYTMPLKANTVYLVEADFGTWADDDDRKVVPVTLSVNGPEGFTSTGVTVTSDIRSSAVDDTPKHFYVAFRTSDKGDYNITLKNAGTDARNIVISNFELYTVKPETRSIPTGNFGTICLPYPFTATGATVYAVEKVEDNVVKLTETEEIVAGKPYIFKATADAQTFAIADGDVTSEPSGDDYLTGVFVDTKATVGTYVLQTQADKGQKFYSVTSEDVAPTIGAYHAYLTVPSTESALRISFGDETTTEVEAIKALTEGKAEIYDLNGRKQNTLRKGVNIVNGVKVIVK